MSVEKIGRSLAALTLVGLLATGCTPDRTPTPTPTPVPPTSQTPTESPQEMQQRLDYEAAEKSYRTFRTEYNRVLRDGGAEKPTRVMKETAGNGYLTEVQKVAEAYAGLKYRQVGNEKIVFVKRGGYSAGAILLNVCEDTRKTHAVNKRGKNLGPGEIRLLEVNVEHRSGRWKLWSGTGKKVDSCA